MKPSGLRSSAESRRTALVCLLLAAVTFAVYWQMGGFEFTNYDESTMILKNPYVLGGLTLNGLSWALTTSWFEYWHPLTWLSHMLDCELFGLSSGWHHLVSLGFHVANTLLLFTVLRGMTGALWRSATVAALFALHPLHVESVAWIAERKDVLSAFFFMLTLWAYARYAGIRSLKSEARSPKPDVRGRWSPSHLPSSIFYLLSLFFFACGLMSKPMLVTLPFVLLLLDYWPLSRLSFLPLPHFPTPLFRLIWEKLPFFALTVASCAITYFGAKAANNILSATAVPWGLRLANVPVSYARYLWKMIWPADLVVLYPMPSYWAGWQVGGAMVVLVLISVFVVLRARSTPCLIVGWLLFLGVLVPTIGFVQVGAQSIADRYTYIPSIGIFIAVVWAGAEWGSRRPRQTEGRRQKIEASNTPRSAVTSLIFDVRRSPTLRSSVHPPQPYAGRATENGTFGVRAPGLAPAQATAAVAAAGSTGWSSGAGVSPAVDRSGVRYPDGRRDTLLAVTVAVALLLCGYLTWVQVGTWRNSFTLWTHCLATTRDNLVAHYNLGHALQRSGQTQQALGQYQAALRIKPDHLDANLNVGVALATLGQTAEATNYFAKALRLKPDYAKAHDSLGMALVELGDFAGAEKHCREAIRLDPDTVRPHFALARALSGQRKSDEALGSYAEALRRSPRESMIHFHLGSEWLKRGSFDQAVSSLEEAVRLDPAWAEARTLLERAAKDRATSERTTHCREVLRLDPESRDALNDLAWILATHPEPQFRNGAEAVQLASRACEGTAWKQTMFVGTLAAAYAEAGQFDKAIATAQKACELASSLGQTNLLTRNQELLRQYQNGQPCREAD